MGRAWVDCNAHHHQQQCQQVCVPYRTLENLVVPCQRCFIPSSSPAFCRDQWTRVLTASLVCPAPSPLAPLFPPTLAAVRPPLRGFLFRFRFFLLFVLPGIGMLALRWRPCPTEVVLAALRCPRSDVPQ